MVMPASRPTVRSLARILGLSRSTVSNALRGVPGVHPETRRRVQAAATANGYQLHPFATRVMSQLRRESESRNFGALAVLELDEPGRPPGAGAFHRDLLTGVTERAAEIGFAVAPWKLGTSGPLSLPRVDQILQSRGIKGLVLLPTCGEADYLALDWKRYVGVYLDRFIDRPSLHTVCADHARILTEALARATALGYRKIGFAITRRSNQRLRGLWIGTFLGYRHVHPEIEFVPWLEADEINAGNFTPWFREHRPDVVIAHWLGAASCMIAAGAKIPQTHGFICLNVQSAEPGVSGFDFQPKQLGARAAEVVIAQLEHNDEGPPTVPSTTLVPARWVEGATVARQAAPVRSRTRAVVAAGAA